MYDYGTYDNDPPYREWQGTAVPEKNYEWLDYDSLPVDGYGSGTVLVDENGDSLFRPGGADDEYYLVDYGNDETKAATFSILGNVTSTTPAELLPSTCPTYSSVIMILLLMTGMAANIVGIAGVIKHRKSCRHYSIYVYVMASNIGILCPLIITAAARFQGWTFGNDLYKVVCFAFNISQSACAFHLTHLVFIRCKEVVRGNKMPQERQYEVISLLVILAAVASAWPSAVFEDACKDIIKNEDTERSYGGKLYIVTYILVGFAFPVIVCLVSVAIAIVEKRKRDSLMIKTPFKIFKDLKKAVTLSVIFFAFWLPFKAWRLQTLQQTMVLGCSVSADAVFYIAISHSTISPIIHYALSVRRKTQERPVYTVDSQEEKRLSVESV